MQKFLNAGCGAHYVDGWINVDVVERHRADIYADLADLPLADASVERIFASHILEHLDYDKQLPQVLAEFFRILKPGAELCVIGPDIERAVALGEPARVLRAIIAWPDEFNGPQWEANTPPTGHAWTATAFFLERALSAAGFSFTPYAGRLRQVVDLGWPLSNVALWQNGYICGR